MAKNKDSKTPKKNDSKKAPAKGTSKNNTKKK